MRTFPDGSLIKEGVAVMGGRSIEDTAWGMRTRTDPAFDVLHLHANGLRFAMLYMEESPLDPMRHDRLLGMTISHVARFVRAVEHTGAFTRAKPLRVAACFAGGFLAQRLANEIPRVVQASRKMITIYPSGTYTTDADWETFWPGVTPEKAGVGDLMRFRRRTFRRF